MTKLCLIAAGISLALSGCATNAQSTMDVGIPAKGEASSVAAPEPAMQDMPVSEEASRDMALLETSPTMILSAYAYIIVDDPEATFAQLRQEVEGMQGKVDAVTLNALNSTPSVTATIRVPKDQFTGFVDKLSTYGNVESLERHSEEVGAVVADMDARINTLTASLERLKELLNKADTVTDVLAAEEQISNRQAELDGLKAQRAWYSEQIDMSRIEITLGTERQYDAPSTGGMAWATLVNAFWSMFFTLVWMVPWVVLLGVLIGLFKLRQRFRSRNDEAPDGKA